MKTDTGNPMAVAVLGLGNPVVSDDAVGLHVAFEVERLLGNNPVPGVTVMTSNRGGFDLIRLLTGYSRAIIIDALELPNPCPGRIHRLQLGMLSGSARLVGVHDISLADAFELAETIGIPMPESVEIFAVEGGEMQNLSEGLTRELEAVVRPLAMEIYDMACKWVNESIHPAFDQNCVESSA
jgi:hydrogenase maturation protease